MRIHPRARLARSPRGALSIAALAGLCVAGSSSCTYERVVSRKGLSTTLARLSETDRGAAGAPSVTARTGTNDVFHLPGGRIRVEDEDGGVTLYAKRVKHLITHIISTLENDERDLFVEQVLSVYTIEEFEERGLDPALAFDRIKERRRDVYELFGAMPMGEATPGLFLEQIGKNMFRLRVPRGRHPDLHWTGIDASFERGNFRLRWFVP